MKISRTLRVSAGVFLALSITAVMALGVIALGSPYKLLVDWWAPWTSPFEGAPRLWAWMVYELCYVRCFQVRQEPGPVFHLTSHDPLTLCIANHPATAAMSPLVRYLTRGRRVRLLFVAKVEHLWNIFLGLPLWLVNGSIFIRRSDRDVALQAIRRKIRKRLRGPTILVIFPDQHRPTPRRIEADRELFAARIEGGTAWLRATPLPRSGGLLEVLFGIQHPLLLLNLTQALGRCQHGVREAQGIFGQTFRVHCEERASTDLPRASGPLQSWLIGEWQTKNELLARWAAGS